MSLNLGIIADAAITALRTDPNWKIVRDELAGLASKHANLALDALPERCVEAAAYARALRDVWVAFEAISTGAPQRAVEKPRITRNHAAG